MTPRERIDAAVDFLTARGVPWSKAAPPHYRLAWLFGLHVRPPHFQTLLGLLVFNSVCCGTLFAVLVSVFERHLAGSALMVAFGVVGGLVVGIVSAPYYRWKAWRFGLPPWDQFPPPPDEDSGW